MKIELVNNEILKSLNAVITYNGETVTIPTNFRVMRRPGLDDPNKLMTELNAHWSRRSESAKENLFRLYRCVRRCHDNFLDRNHYDLTFSEDILLNEVSTYIALIANEHGINRLVQFMKNQYADNVPTDLLIPSDDPRIYSYEDYRRLQAMILAMRSIWPVVNMLNLCLSGTTQYKDAQIYLAAKKQGTSIFSDKAMTRLVLFVQSYMARECGLDISSYPASKAEEITVGVLFGRLSYEELSEPAHIRGGIVTQVYKHLTQAARISGNLRINRLADKISMKSEYTFDVPSVNSGEEPTTDEIKGVKLTNDKK